MATKSPAPDDDVIALEGDGSMHQLIAHAQAQQAQALAEAHAHAHAIAQAQHHHALAQHAAAAGMAEADVHMAVSVDDATAVLSKVDTGTMDFMPLSAAAVVIGSPSGNGGAALPGEHAGGEHGGGADATGASAGLAIKRKSIPLSMKKEAIEWIMGPGKGIPSRAEKHFSALNWDVSASSFRKWWKNREKILGDSSHKKRITGGGRKPYLENREEKLLVVVIQERAKKDRVTRKWIAKTAQHMFQRTNANFKASENWVTKFIRRNGLTLKRSYVTYEQQQQQQPAMSAASVATALAHADDQNGDDDGEPRSDGHIEIDEDMDDDVGAHDQQDEDEAGGGVQVGHDEERKTVLV